MTPEPVLIAFGSTRGGTAEIAQWIAEALRRAGLDPRVRPAREIRSLDEYGAVVIGGSLYPGRRHRDARRLTKRFATVFGGRLAPDARGFIASSMAKNRAGDFRDEQRVTDWAADIAAQIIRC
ncbi:flavodoxin domain-containing protein [Nocardia spumae]|uniref:flavodoxin domain-containing protein n=1 Tax=Nocardia spumae TaxID=2887190 RepID=UPI001D15E347|nr:flavodoxin domain-containing protein [Nocardia spumae]